MRILIAYGTTEGKMRKIASVARGRLEASGHTVAPRDAAELPQDLEMPVSDRGIVAAPVHAGRYQAAVGHFLQRNHQKLNAMTTAFVSVSLAAAGDSDKDRRGLEEYLDRITAETRSKPGVGEHVPGGVPIHRVRFPEALGDEVQRLAPRPTC
jgi:menaquinone-dependent protoporphyrinogen oxidase